MTDLSNSIKRLIDLVYVILAVWAVQEVIVWVMAL